MEVAHAAIEAVLDGTERQVRALIDPAAAALPVCMAP
jgi:hypothetical protein